MMKIKYLLLSTFLIGSAQVVYGQQKLKDNTVLGTPLPNKDAVLELESNKKGLLHARLNLVRTTDSSPLTVHVAGMMVYNTATANDVKPGIYYNDGNKWIVLSNGLAQNISYDPLLYKITFIDGAGAPQSIDLKAMVKANETLTLLVANADGTLSYTDEKGIKKDINLPGLIKTYETESLLKDNGDGTFTFTNEKGKVVTIRLTDGKVGASAYEVAVKNGFNGTETGWLASLKGVTGPAGADGKSVLNGTGAPTGGADGDFFLNTTTNTLYGPKVGGAWPSTGVPLVGPAGPTGATGAAGANGKSVLNGTGAPTGGADGDFFLNTTTNTLYGPKVGGAWPSTGVPLVGPAGPTGATGAAGANGKSVLNGTGAPTGGADGDFFLNTTTNTLYGPKVGGAWPSTGVPLVGPAGPTGAAGANGKSVLNSTGAPTGGADGDFFLNTTTNTLYGPKVGGAWPSTGVALVGPAGATGPAGADGKSVLSGLGAPSGGVDGDFFLNTTTNTLYGPKVGGAWPSTGVPLVGATGAVGANGKSVLNGAGVPSGGVDGDFFLNTTTNTLYGPKAGGAWPSTGVSMVGPAGAVGANGKSVLNGLGAPSGGVDGDFFLNTTTNTLYGPKVGGAWPSTGVPLVGATGAVGANGKSVLNGAGAPSGGVDGDFFLNTTTNTLYGPKVGGAWPSTGAPLVGPAGAAGANGKSVLNGTGAPTGGVDGDFFLNTTTNTLYGPKVGGAWPSTGVPLVGPAGAAGVDGKSIINGTVSPVAGDGKAGDFYLNTVTNILYGPKNESTGWPATGVPLSGPKFFYMPPVIFDTSSPGATEIKRNLYEEFKAQFTGVEFVKNDATGGVAGVIPSGTFVSSTGTAIPAIHIPTVSALDYYITYYDKNAIEIVSLGTNGVLTYKVKANATAATYMNIVFVIK